MSEEHNFEWKIVNFSFWNRDVHGTFIQTTDFYSSKILLHPKGLRGQEDGIWVQIYGHFSAFGELSFYDSDGFLICTKSVNYNNSSLSVCSMYSTALKFEDVVARNKENRPDQEDALIIRCCVRMNSEERHQRLYTILDVFDLSLKIDENMLRKSPAVMPFVGFSSDQKEGGIFVSISDNSADDRYDFYLDPRISSTCAFTVRSHASFTSDGIVMKHHEKEHVFRGGNTPWQFADSVKKIELDDKKVALSLRLKLSTGGVMNRYYHWPLSEVNVSPLDCTPSVPENELVALSKELESLYKSRDFCDFRLVCGDVSYPVHRAILSARSPVLKSMLESASTKVCQEEADAPSVAIGDLDPPTLEQFLNYLYTGSVELNAESGRQLYRAARKYQVLPLRRKCLDFFRSNMAAATVGDVLKMADEHKDEDLGSAARAFVSQHFWEVLRSEEWDAFKQSDPVLAVDTVTLVAQKKCGFL